MYYCSVCDLPIIESDNSVSGYVHQANPLIPLIDSVERSCYGHPVPSLTYSELQDRLADAESFIVRLSHLIQDFEEGL